MTTVAHLYAQGTARLAAAQIDDPQLESAWLLADILGLSRAQIYIDGEQDVAEGQAALFHDSIERRMRHEPFAYIVGHQEFRGLDFQVSPAVLIPRPETELLVDELLTLIDQPRTFSGTLLDLGTGSGILPVSLARELPQATFVAVDLSLPALVVARQNIERHGVAHQVALIAADFLTALHGTAQFDFIVANPPYVRRASFDELQPEVIDHEPHLALDGGGEDGLALIAGFAPALRHHLRPGGWLVMEIGYDQKEAILQLFAGFSFFDQLGVLDDYAGLPRLLKARRRP
ncbi:MAG: peptide chain release factor N(5)-glutamine methyltransferase [Desulfobulbaceae bacterium]|nr:MAG: peptide chain release factor N(5)-glutamine methyltransferase [Desulfobulbaceae bacterium]